MSDEYRTEIIGQTLIGEHVNIIVESINRHAGLISIAVAPTKTFQKPMLGVCVALHKAGLVALRDALNEVIGDSGSCGEEFA